MAKSTKATATAKPVTSAKAASAGVTTTKAPTAPAAPIAAKAVPLTAKASPAAACCGGHTACATPNYEQIAQRAYEIWVAKGRPQGQDIENWKQAEVELTRSALISAA